MGFEDLVSPRCPSERTLRSWMDGELEADLAREVAAHLSACGSCAARVREDRAIGDALRAASPAREDRPVHLASEEILRGAVRSRREEASLITTLRRVAAAAALILFTSTLLAGWNVSSVPRSAEAEAPIKTVGIPSAGMRLGTLIDDENSVIVFMGR